MIFSKQWNPIHSFRIVRRSFSDCLANKIRKIPQKHLFLLQQTVVSLDGVGAFLLDQFNFILFKKSAQRSGWSHHTGLAFTIHQDTRLRYQNILDIFDTHWMSFLPLPVRNHAPLNNFYIIVVGHTIYNNFAKRIFLNHEFRMPFLGCTRWFQQRL